MFTVESIYKFLKESIEQVKNSDCTCRYDLADNLALYVGWGEGFGDELDKSIYQDENDPDYAICAKIADKEEYMWCDYDSNYMPYYVDTEEVYDTDSTLSTDDACLHDDAKYYYKSALDVIKKLEKGELNYAR